MKYLVTFEMAQYDVYGQPVVHKFLFNLMALFDEYDASSKYIDSTLYEYSDYPEAHKTIIRGCLREFPEDYTGVIDEDTVPVYIAEVHSM